MSQAPAVIIGSIANTIPSFSSGPAPGRPVVRDLGILVHVAADAVADQRADDREAGVLDDRLHRVPDVGQVVADPRRLDRREQASAGTSPAAAARSGSTLPIGSVTAESADEAAQRDADVDGEDVAVAERVRPRDAVHDHVVRRRADGAGEAAVALERRDAAAPADGALGQPVELGGRHARPRRVAHDARASPRRPRRRPPSWPAPGRTCGRSREPQCSPAGAS